MSQSVPDILDLSKAWRRAVWSASSMTIAIKCGTARVSSRASIRVVTFVQFRPRSAADTIRSLKSPFKFGENRNADVAWRSAACATRPVTIAVQCAPCLVHVSIPPPPSCNIAGPQPLILSARSSHSFNSVSRFPDGARRSVAHGAIRWRSPSSNRLDTWWCWLKRHVDAGASGLLFNEAVAHRGPEQETPIDMHQIIASRIYGRLATRMSGVARLIFDPDHPITPRTIAAPVRCRLGARPLKRPCVELVGTNSPHACAHDRIRRGAVVRANLFTCRRERRPA